mgnify:CR=1 FL=1
MAEELSPREEVGRDEELLADERERSPVSTRFAAARDGASLFRRKQERRPIFSSVFEHREPERHSPERVVIRPKIAYIAPSRASHSILLPVHLLLLLLLPVLACEMEVASTFHHFLGSQPRRPFHRSPSVE